jgi:hypothetical protein
MDINELQLRLECLRLAQAGASTNSAYPEKEAVIDRARAYADFVLGTGVAEIIDAACKRRSKNPSLKRPDRPVAPE